MKYIRIFIYSILLVACQQSNNSDCNVDIISVENSVRNDLSFLEKIEIIPLETSSNSLIKNIKKMKYIKELDSYLILDTRQIVFLFDKNGNLKFSSYGKRGNGAEEYLMAVDVEYNPYMKSIDLLDPSGVGMVNMYDTLCHWKERITLNQVGETYSIMMPFSDEFYAFAPIFYSDEASRYICLYNWKNKSYDTQKIYYQNYIANIHMINSSLFKLKAGNYFTPPCLDYTFYKIDMQEHRLIPTIKLDFGEKNITKEMLDDRFGSVLEKSDKQSVIDANNKIIMEKNNFLLNSDYPIPVVRLLNDDFVYAYIIANQKNSSFIYNRIDGKGYLITDDFFKIPFGSWLEGNVLYSFISPYDIEQYINKEYMSAETIMKIKKMKEDDNPVILKYYLKK